jgi:HlyD family secretion protein
VKGLGLTAEQQRQLDPILEDMRAQRHALQSLPESERQARAARLRESMRARIRAILTPEQQAKFDETAAAGGGRGRGGGTSGRVFVLDEDGKPKAVPLVLGISDGTATEVLRGDLKEGQEVIVGGGPQLPRATPGSGQGPRLRL